MMEISLISDTLTTIATKYTQINALMLPIDAIAPPTIKPRTAPKKLARKRCRVKRSSKSESDNGDSTFLDGGDFFDGGDGPFGGGGNGGGGGGGNGGGGGFDGFNLDESVPSDPAFDFVYEMLCWIVFSNCLHFALKKVIRIFGEREKVAPIC